MSQSWMLSFTLDGRDAGELGPLLEDDCELVKAVLKASLGDRLRTTTTARWLVEDLRRPLPPVGKPASQTTGRVSTGRTRRPSGNYTNRSD